MAGKKLKSKKKGPGRIGGILILALGLGFCAWVYWGNLPAHRRPAVPTGTRPRAVVPPGEERADTAPGAGKTRPASGPPRTLAGEVRAVEPDEKSLIEGIRRSEAAGKTEEAVRARFELADFYLQRALWEWTEFGRNKPDQELIGKALAVLDEVISRRPGMELEAEARLRRAKVFHNGLSGLWDQEHLREAREELNKVLSLYPHSGAAREARKILARLGK